MKTQMLQFPIQIKKFAPHNELKEKVLDAINRQEQFQHLQGPTNDITRCDWDPARFDRTREWLGIIGAPLSQHLEEWASGLDYDSVDLCEIWFQQYATHSKHSWHVHGGNFTNVYYVDMPDGAPKTKWVDPITKSQYTFDVEEGDIITFPSWLIHSGAENFSKEVKTIISWNMDVHVTDHYGGNSNGNN
jgi:hypothetical protein